MAARASATTHHLLVVRALGAGHAEDIAAAEALRGVPSHMGSVRVFAAWQSDTTDPEVWTVRLRTRLFSTGKPRY
jgi:hypothetical protein